MFTEFTLCFTWRKGLEIYSAKLDINVGRLAHLSFLVVVTWGNIYNECYYARLRSALFGALRPSWQDSNQRYVRGHKNKKILLYFGKTNKVIFTKYFTESTWYLCMRNRPSECRKTSKISDKKTVSVWINTDKYQVDVRHSDILYPPTKWLEKALELIAALDHDKTFCWCFWRGDINMPTWGRCFCFKSYISIHTFDSFDRCHNRSTAIPAEPSVVILVVNISTCNYNWKCLNKSFPAH